MYEELIEKLRDHNACIGIKTLDEAANAIEELNGYLAEAERDRDEYRERLDKTNDMVEKRWIPVTERCPEKSGDYLVFDDCRNLYVNEWHYLLKKWQYDDSRITHWQPLPEPPKEKT